ncbi:hypothetical protein NDJ14_00660 [Vibrio alginolyticus]|uniref:hypothetical protein n=1 Tax=Vibrio alginolyticus TaxID=663 RepID=UPI0021609D2A|nr:hypothetical protein [Vibrio alginolyticus]MCS0127468.1 hypothetical protein [Vibrio alginolyticus]MCS0155461.1 hypothetical protein [Vibrio alginolyticus]
MIGTSTINMRAALQAAQDYLSQDLNAPVGLLCQIYNALQPVDWNDSPEQHFQDWLLCGGDLRVDSILDAQYLFCSGFELALEKMDFQTN